MPKKKGQTAYKCQNTIIQQTTNSEDLKSGVKRGVISFTTVELLKFIKELLSNI